MLLDLLPKPTGIQANQSYLVIAQHTIPSKDSQTIKLVHILLL
jgi:hypothetical protein